MTVNCLFEGIDLMAVVKPMLIMPIYPHDLTERQSGEQPSFADL